MKARKLPALAGWRWLTQGFALFARNPPLLLLTIMLYWLLLLLLSALPVAGSLLASMAIPGLSVGVMLACREVAHGQRFSPLLLLAAWREQPRAMLWLGGIYFLATLAALAISIPADDGRLFAALGGGAVPDETGDSSWLAGVLIALALIPLLLAYWFGPVLAAWHGLPPFKALFFSLIACWINWRAFLIYALALFFYAALLPSLLLLLVSALMPGSATGFAAMIGLPLMLLLMPVIFASFYVSYRDVFQISEHV